MRKVSYNYPYEMHSEDMVRLIAIINDDARQIRNLKKGSKGTQLITSMGFCMRVMTLHLKRM